jgi:hypothetical protein
MEKWMRDGEEDNEIHIPPTTRMRWPERSACCRRRWSKEQLRGAASESFPTSDGDFFYPGGLAGIGMN